MCRAVFVMCRAVLLLLTALLCTGAPGAESDKMQSFRDAIHSAVSDAVQLHCVGARREEEVPISSSGSSSSGSSSGGSSRGCLATCPAGFTACAGRCYVLSPATLPYAAAEQRCDEVNATLAIPRTASENLCAAGLSGGRRVWLGVTDRRVEGEFEAADGTPLGLLDGHRWSATQPDDYRSRDPAGEDCVEMRAAHDFAAWNDESCNSHLLPLCQLRD